MGCSGYLPRWWDQRVPTLSRPEPFTDGKTEKPRPPQVEMWPQRILILLRPLFSNSLICLSVYYLCVCVCSCMAMRVYTCYSLHTWGSEYSLQGAGSLGPQGWVGLSDCQALQNSCYPPSISMVPLVFEMGSFTVWNCAWIILGFKLKLVWQALVEVSFPQLPLPLQSSSRHTGPSEV